MDNDRPQATFNSQPSKHVAIFTVENIISSKYTQTDRWVEPSRVYTKWVYINHRAYRLIPNIAFDEQLYFYTEIEF